VLKDPKTQLTGDQKMGISILFQTTGENGDQEQGPED
jgi:hypothetical protein